MERWLQDMAQRCEQHRKEAQRQSAEQLQTERSCTRCGSAFSGKYGDRCATCDQVHSWRGGFLGFKNQYEELIYTLPRRFQSLEGLKLNLELICSLKNQSAYLWGEPGTGKTIISIAAYHALAASGRNPMFISYPSFIMQAQANFGESYERIERVANHKDLIILDDFGVEKATEYVAQVTYYIVNQREQEELQTIFTSNFSLEEMDSRIDRRISSRIAGICGYKENIIRVTGRDKRREKVI